MGYRLPRLLFAAILIGLLLAQATSARGGDASFPGANGLIAYTWYGLTDAGEYNSEIYVVDPADPSPVNITNTPASERGPAWSPDGKQIAYVRDFQLWVMDANGLGQRQVTDVQSYDPAWSPAGDQLAFPGPDGIYITNLDGTDTHRIVEAPTFPDDGGVSWSPDGRYIVYYGGGSAGYIVEPSGANITELKITNALAFAWSPDGQCLAFSTVNQPNGKSSIGVATLGGDRVTVYQPQVEGSDELPAWSPDGAQIAYVRAVSDTSNQDIWIMNADGTDAHPLMTNTDGEQWVDWQPLPGGGEPAPCPLVAPASASASPASLPIASAEAPSASSSGLPSPTQEAPEDTSDDGTSSTTIVGVIAGTSAAMVALGGLAVYSRRRTKAGP